MFFFFFLFLNKASARCALHLSPRCRCRKGLHLSGSLFTLFTLAAFSAEHTRCRMCCGLPSAHQTCTLLLMCQRQSGTCPLKHRDNAFVLLWFYVKRRSEILVTDGKMGRSVGVSTVGARRGGALLGILTW